MTLTLVEPAHLWIPERAGSYGDEVVDLASLAGIELDPEQCLAVDAICSHREGGRWAALEACVIEGRQNGKTDGIILPVVLADLFLFEADEIAWTAHLFKTTRKSFEAVKRIIEATTELSRRVKKISESNGEESVILASGASLQFLARSKGGGRGLGGKRVVLDEALYLAAASLGALIPTLSARPNPQILYGSSAGVAESEHLRSLRDRGRAGGDPSLVYVEWGTEKGGCTSGDACTHVPGAAGCKLDDEELWRKANPALGRRITVEFVRDERRALPPAEFARERLGWWDDPLLEERPITSAAWSQLAKPRKRRPADVVPVFFVQVAPDSTMSAISAAYPVGGRPYVELADYRPGTSWVVKRCSELAEKFPDSMWAVEAAGAVGSELPALDDQGIAPEPFTVQDMGRACAHLQQLVADRTVAHSGDAAFSVAVSGAVRRTVGEGLWVFSPRKSSVDVSPVTAAAGALWALERFDANYDVLDSVGG